MSATQSALRPDVQSIVDNARPTQNQVDGEVLRRNSLCLDLQKSSMSFVKSMSVDDITDDKSIDPQFVHVSKHIINRTHLQKIRGLDMAISRALDDIAIPSSIMRGGVRLIPVRMIPRVEELMAKYTEERAAEVNVLASNIEPIKKEARERLGENYNEMDYPTEAMIRAKYVVAYRYYTFDIPTTMEGLSQELIQREQEKNRQIWDNIALEGQTALRLSFKALVDKMADLLSPDETGKRKVFREENLNKLLDFVDTLPDRNLFNDKQLQELAQRARRVLHGVSDTQLKVSPSIRHDVLEGMRGLQEQLGELGLGYAADRKFAEDDVV